MVCVKVQMERDEGGDEVDHETRREQGRILELNNSALDIG